MRLADLPWVLDSQGYWMNYYQQLPDGNWLNLHQTPAGVEPYEFKGYICNQHTNRATNAFEILREVDALEAQCLINMEPHDVAPQ
jgi:hypothetical protein